jgi:hypothetical protein
MATTSKTGPDAAPPSGPRLGVSGAGWSEPGPAGGPTAPHPFATPAGERYVELDQLGAGGMGEVALVHDRRLERELAYKRAPLDRSDPEAAARLGREAQITAGLDHPGIVAVYDAGLDDDGRPFYTMRAVRGRSLAQHLAADPGALARRTLVRQLLAVCEAIGYAHERGVIHRDLTPANVMLGDFGEVQVVDWGLAVRRGEDIVERGAGTPGYMSPERRAGRSAGGEPTSDVWALGTMLREVAGPAPLASELTAILARATATEPSARYLDAGALADDLRRYLDGRPVAAYTYSPLELARRALWAWRWPLATLAAALAVGGAVAVGAWQRVERARDRAVSAELAARAALADARTSLGHALAARAVRALEDHAIPEAEALAAQALVAVESPDARGVLAATRAVVAPRAAVHYRLPGCVTVLDADPVDALCVDGGDLVLWSLAGNRVRWRVPGVPHDAVFGPNGTVLVTRFGEGVYALDRATGADRYTVGQGGRRSRLVLDPTAPQVAIHGNRHYTVTDLEHQIVLEDGMICGPDLTQDLEVIALAGARRVAACRDGSLWTATVGPAVALPRTAPEPRARRADRDRAARRRPVRDRHQPRLDPVGHRRALRAGPARARALRAHRPARVGRRPPAGARRSRRRAGVERRRQRRAPAPAGHRQPPRPAPRRSAPGDRPRGLALGPRRDHRRAGLDRGGRGLERRGQPRWPLDRSRSARRPGRAARRHHRRGHDAGAVRQPRPSSRSASPPMAAS